MCALNEDIIRHIADYLPLETLDKINGSNSVFYEAWMKARYSSVAITKRDKETKRLLAHLSSQPDVAQHVRKLTLRPWLVQPRTKSPRSRTENVIMKCMQVVDPHYTKKTAEQRLQKRLWKDKTRLLAAFAEMSRLQEYTIDWDESDIFHQEFYQAFLVPPMEKWASHLTSLTIHVPLSMISSLARLHLSRLESLTYHFSTGNTDLKDIHHAHDGFIVFINNLKDSLQSLSLSSTSTSQHLDLSRVFRMMGTFRFLTKVSLSIPFDGGQLSDPIMFAEFLRRHSGTLREFNLTTSRCATHFKPGDPQHIYWIQHILQSFDQPFPLLSNFGIAMRPLKAPLDILMNFLDMHSSTLESVSLMDRLLSVHDIQQLFSSSPDHGKGIHELCIKVEALSPTFLLYLAYQFPTLKTLRLDCSRVEMDHTFGMDPRHKGGTDFLSRLDVNHKQSIKDWSLQHLAIPESRSILPIEQDLARYIPGLTVSSLTL